MAVIGVLIGHFTPLPLINAGRAGVELFFALSGCLIGTLLFQNKLPLMEFAAKRLARIIPSMWLFIAIAALTALAFDETLGTPWLHMFGVGNYAENYLQRTDHLWSVCIELQGYLTLGIVALVSRRTHTNPATWIFIIILASWALIFTTTTSASNYYSFYWRFEYRLTAMLLGAALTIVSIDRIPTKNWTLLLLLGLTLQLNGVPDSIKYTIGSAVIALACCILMKEGSSKALSNRILVAFGTASFSIYLYQQIFMYEARNIGHWTALAIAIIVGFVGHHWWDKKLHFATASFLLEIVRRNSRKPHP